mgnify:CR=1 FL=1
MLLSGDTAGSAKRVAEQLGIPCFEGGMKPEDKQNRIKGLVANGRIVAMVGDGINDAPALISSSVGVAVGSGTDVAVESAAVVLLGSNLLKFVECIRIARQCRRIILSNFAITIVIDIAGMALAFFGLLPPVFAALVHAISEALCLFNSARLLPFDYARDALSKKRKHNNHSHSSTVHHTCNKNC